MEIFASLLILWARRAGKGFWNLPGLWGGFPHSVRASLVTWLERLSPNHRSHSPASFVFTKSIKEILTTVTD